MSALSPFWSLLSTQSRSPKARIGFSDYNDPRILEAVKSLKTLSFIDPILVRPNKFNNNVRNSIKNALSKRLSYDMLNKENVDQKLDDSLYLGLGLLMAGEIDGLLAGATRPTADVVKGALHWVGSAPGHKIVSGHFIVESPLLSTPNPGPLIFADCAVVPEPSPRALASIALSAAESCQFFLKTTPKIALLSFSTAGSAEHPLVDRIRQALDLIKSHHPDLVVDGEIQVDAALDPHVAQLKGVGESPVAGKANVFIFPTLESGNIGYKLVQRFSMPRIAGPILWGLNKPVSDLSRGCQTQEIIDTALCVSQMVGA